MIFWTSSTIYGGDSAELIVTSYNLSIPHPPGYPLYNLLGKLITILIPFGNIAYRVNLLSTLLSSIIIGVLFSVVKKISKNIFFSIILIVIFLLSKIFISQSGVSEVFILNLFLGLIIIKSFLFLNYKNLLLASFIFGLGLGNHQTIIFLIPFCGLIFIKKMIKKEFNISFNFFLTLIFFFVLGFSVNLYLPIRAKINPPINFGAPEDWNRFWNVFLRKEFGTLQLHPEAIALKNFDVLSTQFKVFFSEFYKNFGILAFLIIFGFLKNLETLGLSLTFFVAGPFFIIYSNLSPDALSMWRLERFHLLSNLIFLVFMSYLYKFLKFKHKNFLVFLFFLFYFFTKDSPENFRNNFIFYDFGKNILKSVKNNSLLIIDNVFFDEPTSSVMYSYLVEKKRNDVNIFYRPATMLINWQKDFWNLPRDERQNIISNYENNLIKSYKNIFGLAFDKNNLPVKTNLYGIVNSNIPIEEPSVFYQNHNNILEFEDYPSRLMLVHYLYFKAKENLQMEEFSKAERYFEVSSKLGYDMSWLNYNIATIYAKLDKLEIAQKYFDKAKKYGRFFPDTYFGLGYIYYKMKKLDKARDNFIFLLKLKPKHIEGIYNLGVVYLEAEDFSNAIETFERYLSFDSTSQRAKMVKETLSSLKNQIQYIDE